VVQILRIPQGRKKKFENRRGLKDVVHQVTEKERGIIIAKKAERWGTLDLQYL